MRLHALPSALRQALRTLSRAPGFTAVAILMLGLGIGANTAAFSAVYALLLDPLPFPGGDRMVYVWQTSPNAGMSTAPTEEAAEAWRSAHSFEATERYQPSRMLLGDREEPEFVDTKSIEPTFFSFLGTQPALGRAFTAEEGAAGGPDVAILGYGAWQRRFAGDPHVLGRTLTLDGRSYTIVGVAPESLVRSDLGGKTEAWLPLRPGAGRTAVPTISLVARLRPGVSAEAAEKELDAIRSRLQETVPFFHDWRSSLRRPQDFLGGDLSKSLMLLAGAVGFVLLIACANIAGLLVARGEARSREMAIRASLGASRGALVRHLLMESLILAVGAGAAGVGVAVWALRLVAHARPEGLDALDRVAVDGHALLFTAGASVVSALLLGVLPALQASDVRLSEALRGGGSGSVGSRSRTRSRSVLVAVEIALSVVLLTGAGLLVRSLASLGQVDPGFRAERLALARIPLPARLTATPATFETFSRSLERSARLLPGVVDARVAGEVPLDYGLALGEMQVEGGTVTEAVAKGQHAVARVPDGYFSLLGIPLLAGREFGPADLRPGSHSVILSDRFARTLFPRGTAVGRRIRFSPESDWLTVVGVAKDVATSTLRAGPSLQLYVAYSGETALAGETWLMVRTRGNPEPLLPLLRRAIRSVDPTLALPEVVTGEGLVASQLAEPRFYATLLGAFALLALLLASVGLYGVISYAVTRRSHEIGVRMALGAASEDVVRLVVRQGLVPMALGTAAGLAASFAMTRLLQGLLYGVSATDPLTFAAVGATLLAVATMASFIPARRATRVDPLVALRAE